MTITYTYCSAFQASHYVTETPDVRHQRVKMTVVQKLMLSSLLHFQILFALTDKIWLAPSKSSQDVYSSSRHY